MGNMLVESDKLGIFLTFSIVCPYFIRGLTVDYTSASIQSLFFVGILCKNLLCYGCVSVNKRHGKITLVNNLPAKDITFCRPNFYNVTF